MHAWPIGVEDTSDFDAQLVLAPISEEQALRAALAFMSVAAVFDGPLSKNFDGLPASASRAL